MVEHNLICTVQFLYLYFTMKMIAQGPREKSFRGLVQYMKLGP